MKRIIIATASGIAAAALAGCGGSTSPVVTVTATATQTQTQAQSVAPPSNTPTPEPSTPEAQHVGEYQTLSTDLASLMSDFSDYAQAGDFSGAADTLEAIGNKAQEGLELPSVGIDAIDTEWDAAMGDLISSARIGVPAINNLDAGQMRKATAYLTKATGHIEKASAAIQALTGA